jgi:hypothetical protein
MNENIGIIYIHTYKNLFKHAGLNNSELISMRGVIWREYTVQINIKNTKTKKEELHIQ